jgi:hypothetical protein
MAEDPFVSGRNLPTVPASGYGGYCDIRTGISVFTPSSSEAAEDRDPLVAYVSGSNVLIAPGFVNNVMPTISGTPLDAATPPSLALSAGDNYIHLKGTYTPTVYTIATGYAAIGSAGTVSSVEFVVNGSPSGTEDYPKISGGSAVDGEFDILWGKFNKDGDVVTTEVPSGGGNAWVVFMPPNLYAAFRDVNASAV